MTAFNLADTLRSLGLDPKRFAAGSLSVFSPIDGSLIGKLAEDDEAAVAKKIENAVATFEAWRDVPAPKRGEVVRLFGDLLRKNKDALGTLVTIENGKILEEGKGEVQEMIDICDFAVGLSRQLYGLTIASERPGHKMRELWHPLGPVGVISAFNFPVAVWAWNAALAFVCGDPVIWKPSEKVPISAVATQHLFEQAAAAAGAPEHLSQIILCGRKVAKVMVEDPRVPLISATGSTVMGEAVGPVVAKRFGRSILELGGNNGVIVAPSADLDLALRGILFGAAGTCGQRCTSTRRLMVHESIYNALVPRLKKAYASIAVGNPLEKDALVGPLIDGGAFEGMEKALERAKKDGGEVTGGGRALQNKFPNAYYVKPAIVEMKTQTEVVREETFAPILYIMKYKTLDEAIKIHNGVPQGLSSAIFTNDVREAESFTAPSGSDCGIANVNIGTSGAEIGGAFGGEKATGGGRESGSDSWKAYMRRATSTVNYSADLPLAQGIKFETE
jgi:L-aminoadipate-semialdehyde dehydrogenase